MKTVEAVGSTGVVVAASANADWSMTAAVAALVATVLLFVAWVPGNGALTGRLTRRSARCTSAK